MLVVATALMAFMSLKVCDVRGVSFNCGYHYIRALVLIVGC